MQTSQATQWTWNGNGGNANWITLANWDIGSVPVSAASTDIAFGGTNNVGTALVPLNQNIVTPFLLNSIAFNNLAGSFFLGGSALRFEGGSSNSITQNSSSAQNIANSIAAPSTNASVTLTLAGSGAGVVTMSGVISAGSGQRDYAIVKTGNSVFSLSGANTYAGGTTINGGTLVINNVASLGATTGALTLNAGTLEVATGFITTRNIILGNAASTIQVDPSQTYTVSSSVTGTGGLTKDGTGTLSLSGANTNSFTGTTTVNAGMLSLVKNAGDITNNYGGAIRGNIVINSGATVQIGNNSQIDDTKNIWINGGTLDLTSTWADGSGSGGIQFTGGNITGTGDFYLGSNLITNAASTTATISAGRVFLNTAAPHFTLAAGTAPSGIDLSITGAITNFGANTSFIKDGTGTLSLSGANSYTGTTTVNAGVLNIQSASALGTAAAGTTVSSGAALQIQGGISVGAEPLGLSGSGIASDGAFRNISGNNSFAGAITLTSASTISSDSGTLTLTAGIANGGFTTTFGGANNILESGVISGGGALIKNGSGTLTLNATNTFTGGSTINGGTVIVYGGSLGANSGVAAINAGTLDVAATVGSARNFVLGSVASTVMVDPAFIFTTTGIFSGPGALNKTGSGTLVLGGINTYSGATNVSAGTLQISANERILNTSDVNISGGTFDLQTFGETVGNVTLSSGSITGTGAGSLTASAFTLQSGTASAILAGTGTVTKNTAGTVTLSGANTFTGSTTISAGTLQVNTNNALGTAVSGTTVANGAVLRFNNVNYSTAEPLTLNGSGISNGGALTNTGTSTFAGPINAATDATINAGGGTLNLTGGISKNGTTLTIAGGGTVNVTLNGITGSSPNSDLVVNGTTLVLSAPNSYNGPTTVQNSGTLKLGGNNVLPTSPQTALTVNTTSIFDLAGYSDGVASLAGDSSGIVKNSVATSTSTFTINPGSGVTTTFAGLIAGTNGGAQGNIAVQKDGAGTLVLTGTNTYSGTTTVTAGTLIAAASSGSALGSTSNVLVNWGGILLLGANNQVNNSATMTLAGGTFAKGNFSQGTASAAGLGGLSLTSGSVVDFGIGAVGVLSFASFAPGAFTLTIDNWSGAPGMVGDGTTDRLIFATDQTANLGSFVFTGYGSGAREIDLGNGYYEIVAAVPEPSTVVTAVLTFLPIGVRRLARRRPDAAPKSV